MLPKGFAELGSEKMSKASKKLREFYFPNGATQEGFIQVRDILKCQSLKSLSGSIVHNIYPRSVQCS